MKRQFFLTAFLLLLGTNTAFAQNSNRGLEQVRRETYERDRIVNDPANNPFNRGVSPTGRFVGYGIPSGAETRKYILAAQAQTEVKVLSAGDADMLLVDDGSNKTIVRILGIDAPEEGQPNYEEAKNKLSDLLLGKKVLLKYSLHNLKDAEGHFLARVFVNGKDVGLNMLENGFAWRSQKDKYFLERKDDDENVKAEAKARASKIGIWQDAKPQKPWEYKEKLKKEKTSKN